MELKNGLELVEEPAKNVEKQKAEIWHKRQELIKENGRRKKSKICKFFHFDL